ncbi:MAG: pyruvate:ferredoxin (flavodoxin) oxidoreductase [Akkermansiaceae bacterium]|nr:pyruvate:ferredoxin (flavodoxin) oxidoreductase [Akkermansiaceae bacterium]MCP5542539.1 pyruvate:ferredoxin (flavodoxin) oxidoreductase [Akkermansiaceae bacterium]MCP5547921.1 pyruvate:ferredoxin (flavodoxin) oxidoreductase [Akkermansiaceae bacterium]
MDANEAVASVAYRLNEFFAIYPITPSSPMAEFADEWSAASKPNLWGAVPSVVEMQSEGGAAGALHGALQAGSLSASFTASQGLLLMIPNMFKIAGELSPFCLHVTARAVATHALSIFGDHSDVMACRQTGFAMLCGGSVQEAMDTAVISQMVTLKSRVPFLHFFDGFRTSHEVSKIQLLSDDDLRSLVDEDAIAALRDRALTPDAPKIRGTAQNPDAFFQAREGCNSFYDKLPELVKEAMDAFAARTGRAYKPFDYDGAPDAEHVVVIMGSGAEAVSETVDALNEGGRKTGVIKVRLYRPFCVEEFAATLPKSVKSIAVLDRTKEPGALGEPLYLDVVAALRQAETLGLLENTSAIKVTGGRYGLGSKEFNCAMVKAVFDELAKDDPKKVFTVGINDDVTGLSLDYDPAFEVETPGMKQAVFFGLGSDGTVGANKNSIKIIGEGTDNYAQGYFVYDSKKAGAMTVSHLRFGPKPIRATYLIRQAEFVACHRFDLLHQVDVLSYAKPNGIFLLNSPGDPDEAWSRLPREIQEQIILKNLSFYAIDASSVARAVGMPGRINTIMQTCYFAISGVLPKDEAIAQIKYAIKKTYGKRGDAVVQKNYEAVDSTLANLKQINYPDAPTSTHHLNPVVPEDAPDFVKRVTALMLAGKGDLLPVSAFPVDGTWPTGTTQWEKRNIAEEIPVWETDICIQCNKCSLVCPHAAIRPKVYQPELLENAPPTFKSTDFKVRDFAGMKYTLQVAAEDCTGCHLCVQVCPAKDKSNPSRKAINMAPQLPLRDAERENFAFFNELPDPDRAMLKDDVKTTQFMKPLFEFSGACAGCGETPYIKLLTQMFGDRMLMANATGCSSIYGGNLPTTPYTTDHCGRGPAWANSLFEDNAEFGLGMRASLDQSKVFAEHLVRGQASVLGDDLVSAILSADQSTEQGIEEQRKRVVALRSALSGQTSSEAKSLAQVADYLVNKSVWIVGGDGWAYDIGFGGLDHVIASGRNVNILVLDTEVYSNTGGQQSKSTPLGAVAKFSMAGKAVPKKDLGLIASSYGTVYVARVSLGAKDSHVVSVFREAESYDGPSLVIAYSHCVAHGYSLSQGLEQQKKAVACGYWPLFRFDPRRAEKGENPMKLDSGAPKGSLADFTRNETRFQMLARINPERSAMLHEMAEESVKERYALYQQMAASMEPAPAAE